MINVHYPSVTAASDTTSRVIDGVAVPWDVEGRVESGATVVFHAGSLDAASRPVALRDHDRSRPIGRVVDATDTGEALTVRVRVAATRDGDEALVLAAPPDQVLGMFSVGAEPTDWHYDDQGVLHVNAADWLELSLLPIGAYTQAVVTHVAATRGAAMSIAELDTPVEPDEPDTPDDEEPDTPEEHITQPVPVVTAGRTTRRERTFDIRAVAQTACLVNAGGRTNRRLAMELLDKMPRLQVNAALADVTLVGTNNVGTMHRPAYQAEIADIIEPGAPIVASIRHADLQRGDYPNVSFVVWDKTPQVAVTSPEKVAIPSSPVGTKTTACPVQTWSTGNDISQQTLDLGSPTFVEQYIRAAAIDYATTTDTYAATALLSAATAVTTVTTDTFIQVVGKLFGAMNPQNVPPGALNLAVSWDVWASLISVKQTDGPAFWSASMSLGSQPPSLTGALPNVFPDLNLPAKTYLMYLRNAAIWFEPSGVPYNLQAINVGNLGLDIAVYGYGAIGVMYPGAVVKTTVP